MRSDRKPWCLSITDEVSIQLKDFFRQVCIEVLNVDAVFEQEHVALPVDAGIGIEHSDDDSANPPFGQTPSAGNLIFAPLEAWLQRCEYGGISNDPRTQLFL